MNWLLCPCCPSPKLKLWHQIGASYCRPRVKARARALTCGSSFKSHLSLSPLFLKILFYAACTVLRTGLDMEYCFNPATLYCASNCFRPGCIQGDYTKSSYVSALLACCAPRRIIKHLPSRSSLQYKRRHFFLVFYWSHQPVDWKL